MCKICYPRSTILPINEQRHRFLMWKWLQNEKITYLKKIVATGRVRCYDFKESGTVWIEVEQILIPLCKKFLSLIHFAVGWFYSAAVHRKNDFSKNWGVGSYLSPSRRPKLICSVVEVENLGLYSCPAPATSCTCWVGKLKSPDRAISTALPKSLLLRKCPIVYNSSTQYTQRCNTSLHCHIAYND